MACYPVLFILDDTNGWLSDTPELYRNKQWSKGIKEEESKRKIADSMRSTNSSVSSTNSQRISLIRIVADNALELVVIKETFKLHGDVKSIKDDTGKSLCEQRFKMSLELSIFSFLNSSIDNSIDNLSSAEYVMDFLNAFLADPGVARGLLYNHLRH